MSNYLEISQLVKGFPNKLIYSNVSFTFQTGCYAITGENGVGKTVLLEMLAGISPHQAGHIALSGVGSNTSLAYKRQLAYIPDKPSFFPIAKGWQFLDFIASLNGFNKADHHHNALIKAFNLTSHLSHSFSSLSLGTQKKLFLSTLNIGNKSLFILDEPTNGLDIEACSVIAHFLLEAAKKTIVILATHDQALLKALNPSIIHLTNTPISEISPC